MFKLVNEDSEKLQKNFKISSQHPTSGAFGGVLAAFGNPRRPRGSPIFYSDFYKFSSESSKILFRKCSEESQRPLNGLSAEFRKSVLRSLTQLTAALKPHNISKNFSTIWRPCICPYIRGTSIRCTSKHKPSHKTARECTANSAVNPAADPAMESAVDLRRT